MFDDVECHLVSLRKVMPIKIFLIFGKTMKVSSSTFPVFQIWSWPAFWPGQWCHWRPVLWMWVGVNPGAMLQGRWLKFFWVHFLEVRFEQHLWAKNEHFQYFKFLLEYITFGGFCLDSRLLTLVYFHCFPFQISFSGVLVSLFQSLRRCHFHYH